MTDTLNPDQRRKVREIRAALGKSDRAIHAHFVALDRFERAALNAKSPNVNRAWPRTLDELHGELLTTRARLDRLNTGLRAQELFHKSLGYAAQAVDHWRRALRSRDPRAIARLRHEMQQAFAASASAGQRAEHDLNRGR